VTLLSAFAPEVTTVRPEWTILHLALSDSSVRLTPSLAWTRLVLSTQPSVLSAQADTIVMRRLSRRLSLTRELSTVTQDTSVWERQVLLTPTMDSDLPPSSETSALRVTTALRRALPLLLALPLPTKIGRDRTSARTAQKATTALCSRPSQPSVRKVTVPPDPLHPPCARMEHTPTRPLHSSHPRVTVTSAHPRCSARTDSWEDPTRWPTATTTASAIPVTSAIMERPQPLTPTRSAQSVTTAPRAPCSPSDALSVFTIHRQENRYSPRVCHASQATTVSRTTV
jgi:hypothetical protein